MKYTSVATQRKIKAQKGVILIWMTFILPILFILLGFVIDIGYQIMINNELQSATQAGAHAGAIDIYKGVSNAENTARKQILKNSNKLLNLSSANIKIEVGKWDGRLSRFIATRKDPNSIKVYVSKEDQFFFSKHINFGIYSIGATSIAYHYNSTQPPKIYLVAN